MRFIRQYRTWMHWMAQSCDRVNNEPSESTRSHILTRMAATWAPSYYNHSALLLFCYSFMYLPIFTLTKGRILLLISAIWVAGISFVNAPFFCARLFTRSIYIVLYTIFMNIPFSSSLANTWCSFVSVHSILGCDVRREGDESSAIDYFLPRLLVHPLSLEINPFFNVFFVAEEKRNNDDGKL